MSHPLRQSFGAALTSLFCASLPVLAYADASSTNEDANGALQISPYLWAAGIKGNISPFQRSPAFHIDKPFSEIFDDLNFGGFVQILGRRDRWVLLADLMHVDTSSHYRYGPLPTLPPPLPPIVGVDGKLRSKQTVASLLGGYRVYDQPNLSIDLMAGLRHWHISNEVTVWSGSQSGSYQERFHWFDPIVGARARLHFTPDLSVVVLGDAGGFGAGAKHSYQFQATLNYSINADFALSAGYKTMSVDYENNGNIFDTTLAGPVVGLTYTHRF